MATIDQFKAQLIGGGPRANRFRVFVPRAGNNIELLVTATSMPASEIAEIAVPFRGMQLKLAGDRTFSPWAVTIINDIDFSSRTALELWQEEIAGYGDSAAATTNDYLVSRAFVEQLGKDDSVLARYEFFNMFPTSIAAITLDTAEATALETFEVTFSYSHWERTV